MDILGQDKLFSNIIQSTQGFLRASSSRVLCSRLEGHGIDPCPMLDGSGVKAMPPSIPAPNPGSFIIRKERFFKSLPWLANRNMLLKIVKCCNIFLWQYCVQKCLV